MSKKAGKESLIGFMPLRPPRWGKGGRDNENGILYYKDRVCVLNDSELKKVILKEAHSEFFSMHPGSTKMYQDLKVLYW